ncbi:hypothetical protein [Peristeroidobacter soli]|uniref:hypothetical protein n=1 Tax=Peristeroidobacter soli TaxID=2497877 RepID=UPI00101CE376|nr:hypothetical protein [Peristeroidobacter soli]
MMRFRVVALALLFCCLWGCGGGGGGDGGDDTSISLSTSSITLDADLGSTSFASSTLTVNFRGAGVVVGTLPGQTMPTWLLSPVPENSTTTQVVFSVRAFAYSMPRGTYTTTLRFVTGREDQSHLKTADLTVTLRVNTPFNASVAAPLAFVQADGATSATAVGPSAIQIVGENLQWRATANQPWVGFGATSGTQAGNLTITANRQSLPLGVHTAQISIIDDRRNRTLTFPVTFEIRPARIALSASTFDYTVTPQTLATEFTRSLTVSDELNGTNAAKGVTWTATTGAPWLTLSSGAGSSASNQQLTVSLDSARLNVLPSGTYNTSITFNYQDSGGSARTAELPVTLNVRMPLARAASPYLLAPGAGATLRLRGQDIRDVDMSSLSVDGASAATLTRVDADSVTLQMPALGAGVYPIRFNTASGLTRSAARVVVQASNLGEGVIQSPNAKRLVLDEQRGRLIAIDRTQSQLESYRWNGATWAAEITLTIPEIADAVLTRNGEEVIVVARHAIYALDADDLSQPRTEVWALPSGQNRTASFNTIQLNELGVGLIAQTYHFAGLSGNTSILRFDSILRDAPTGFNFESLYEAQLAQSPTGRYLMVGEYGVSPPIAPWLYDSDDIATGLLGARTTPIQTGGSIAIQISHSETRILQSFAQVYNFSGQLLGRLPTGGYIQNFATLSPNGERAYRLVRTPSGSSLAVHDLTATPTPEYPEIDQVALPADVIQYNADIALYPGATLSVAAVMSRDGRYLFLAGPERIVVVDVN